MAPTNVRPRPTCACSTDHNWAGHCSVARWTRPPTGIVTALQLEKRLVFRLRFRREDYPWLMSWMNFTGDDHARAAMEFSTQTFDISHGIVALSPPVLARPTFRWLPAKSTIETRFPDVYTRVPEGFTKNRQRGLRERKITILDHSGKRRWQPRKASSNCSRSSACFVGRAILPAAAFLGGLFAG